MTSSAVENLSRLGITLPDAPAPAANYVPYVIAGNMVFVSGQLPLVEGKLSVTGHVGKDVTTEQAAKQARRRSETERDAEKLKAAATVECPTGSPGKAECHIHGETTSCLTTMLIGCDLVQGGCRSSVFSFVVAAGYTVQKSSNEKNC